MDSHYFRAKLNKEYLESGLSTEKMYELSKIECAKKLAMLLSYHLITIIISMLISILVFILRQQRYVIDVRKWNNNNNNNNNKKQQQQQRGTTANYWGGRKESWAHLNENGQISLEKQRDKSDVSDNKFNVLFHAENVITFVKADAGSFLFLKKGN